MVKTVKNKNNNNEKQANKMGLQIRNKFKAEDHLAHIPFKLREIMKNKNRMMENTKSKKNKKARPKPESRNDDIPVPRFRKGKRESEKAFVRRMDNEIQHVLFLTENQVQRKPELDPNQELANEQGKSDKKKDYDKMRLNKLQLKKFNKKEKKMEKEMFVDHVPFGEVALAPPSLSAKPRKAPEKSQAPKELFLNSLLGHTATSKATPSMARRRLMEEERQRVVEAYRLLKKQKENGATRRKASS